MIHAITIIKPWVLRTEGLLQGKMRPLDPESFVGRSPRGRLRVGTVSWDSHLIDGLRTSERSTNPSVRVIYGKVRITRSGEECIFNISL